MNFIASNHNNHKNDIQHFFQHINLSLSLLPVPSVKIMRRKYFQETNIINCVSVANPSDEINNQTSAHLPPHNAPLTLRLLTLKCTYACVQDMQLLF